MAEILTSQRIDINALMLNNKKLTLDCVVLIEGENFSEPIETNIIVSKKWLVTTLKKLEDKISLEVLNKIEKHKSMKKKTLSLPESICIKKPIQLNPYYMDDGYLLFFDVVNDL